MEESSVRQKMQAALQALQSDLATVRTGRATSALVEDIIVNAYGGASKLRVVELASITIPDPQTIMIEPWDKSVAGEIRQGILAANVGFTPSLDGAVIRISLPPMTSEDREKYIKLLNTKLEQGRISIRQVRGDAMHDIKKAFEDKELSEDEKFAQEKRVQELTDEFVGKIDELGKVKTQELLQI